MFSWLAKILMPDQPRSPTPPPLPRSAVQGSPRPRIRAASYEAATTGRNYDNYYAYALDTSANAELTAAIRRRIRNRARYELRNNCYARGMCDTKSNYVVGTGPRLQLMIDDSGIASATEALWRRWSRRVAYDEILRQALVARYGDSGEAFVVYSDLDYQVPLLPVLVECDRVYAPQDQTATSDDGIVYDSLGRPKTYYICDTHPGDTYGQALSFTAYPAELVSHVFRQIRPGQRRGIPDITPALPLFGNLRRFSMATLGAAETAADFAAVLYSDMSAQDQELNPLAPDMVDPFTTYDIERNQAMTLPYGWKMSQFKAEHPNAQHWDFVRACINEASRCLEMPVSVALLNSERLNYASGRLDHQVFFKSIIIERQRLCNQLVYPTVSRFLAFARLLVPGLSLLNETPYDIVWDGFQHVDPAKEANAAQVRLSNRMMSYAQHYAHEGLDWEEQFEQIAKEKALMDSLGITPADVMRDMQEREDNDDDEDIGSDT
jgi:capsid protein